MVRNGTSTTPAVFSQHRQEELFVRSRARMTRSVIPVVNYSENQRNETYTEMKTDVRTDVSAHMISACFDNTFPFLPWSCL